MSEVSWQELTKSECFGLPSAQHLGRVVRVDDRRPIAVPVNFVLDRHTVVFRSDEGIKLDVAIRRAYVAFEVDGADEATHIGWSVLVRGEATESLTRMTWREWANCCPTRGRPVPRPTTSGSCRRS